MCSCNCNSSSNSSSIHKSLIIATHRICPLHDYWSLYRLPSVIFKLIHFYIYISLHLIESGVFSIYFCFPYSLLYFPPFFDPLLPSFHRSISYLFLHVLCHLLSHFYILFNLQRLLYSSLGFLL